MGKIDLSSVLIFVLATLGCTSTNPDYIGSASISDEMVAGESVSPMPGTGVTQPQPGDDNAASNPLAGATANAGIPAMQTTGGTSTSSSDGQSRIGGAATGPGTPSTAGTANMTGPMAGMTPVPTPGGGTAGRPSRAGEDPMNGGQFMSGGQIGFGGAAATGGQPNPAGQAMAGGLAVTGGQSGGGGDIPLDDRDNDNFGDAEDCEPDDSESFPGAEERCDFIDNDCDNSVDEGVPNCCGEVGAMKPCGSDVGLCEQGVQICMAGGMFGPCMGAIQSTDETCNGLDDDCNGVVDDGLTRRCETDCGEGIEVCQNGAWNACSAPEPIFETCNDTDDDCDTRVDEDVVLMACATACGAGIQRCEQGALSCDGPQPTAEICDGLDNDCDDAIDEDADVRCESECGAGVQACVDGQLQACTRPNEGPEICDGEDNDCDGQTDEGLDSLCVHLIGRVDGPEGSDDFGTEIWAKGDLTGDGISDVVANSAGNGNRFIAILDGRTATLSCSTNGGGAAFANSFSVGDLVPGGSLEIVATVRDDNNPMIRVFDTECTEKDDLRLNGDLFFSARGDIAMTSDYAGFAVSDPQSNFNSGRVRIYEYRDGELNEAWAFSGTVGRRSIGERLYFFNGFGNDERPDLIATIRQGFGSRATSLYYSATPNQPSGPLEPPVETENSHGESIIAGNLLNNNERIFAFGAPSIQVRENQTGGIYFVDSQPSYVEDGIVLRPQGDGINIGRRLAQFRSEERGQTYLIPAGQYGRIDVWRLRLRNNGTIANNAVAQLFPDVDGGRFGWTVAAGETGADGTGRLFVSAPDEGPRGRIYVYSIR